MAVLVGEIVRGDDFADQSLSARVLDRRSVVWRPQLGREAGGSLGRARRTVRFGFGSMGWVLRRARPGVSRADGCSGSGSGAAEWSGSAGRCVMDPCGGRGRPFPGADGRSSCEVEPVSRPAPCRLREHGLGSRSGSAGRVEGGWMLWKRKWRDRCGGFGASGRGDRSWGRFPGPGVRCLRSRPTFGGLATTTRSRYELTMSSPLRGLPRVGFGSMGWGRGRARPGVSRADGCSGSASARPLRRAWPFWSGKSFVGTTSPTSR